MRILPERGLAVFRFDGVLCVRDAKQAFLDYVRMPGFDPSFTMVTDARDVTEVRASFGEIVGNVLTLMRVLRIFDRPVTSVILVSEANPFVMARALDQVLETASHIRVEVVRDEHEALSRVGCPDTTLRALTGAAA